MLVLTRKRDEAIRIGDDITIVVVEIRGDKVRLGVEASREVSVHRQEVYDAIKNQKGFEKRPKKDKIWETREVLTRKLEETAKSYKADGWELVNYEKLGMTNEFRLVLRRKRATA